MAKYWANILGIWSHWLCVHKRERERLSVNEKDVMCVKKRLCAQEREKERESTYDWKWQFVFGGWGREYLLSFQSEVQTMRERKIRRRSLCDKEDAKSHFYREKDLPSIWCTPSYTDKIFSQFLLLQLNNLLVSETGTNHISD